MKQSMRKIKQSVVKKTITKFIDSEWHDNFKRGWPFVRAFNVFMATDKTSVHVLCLRNYIPFDDAQWDELWIEYKRQVPK